MEEIDKGNILKAKKWVEAVGRGRFGYEIETMGTQGLKVVRAQKGLMQGTFVVPKTLTDRDGNWHIGAMAVLIDNVGAAAIGSSVGEVKASVNFDISYFSPVKFEEEVEFEAKVLNHKEKLSSVMVEIRRKEKNGELVALGKQWMISHGANQKQPQTNRSKL